MRTPLRKLAFAVAASAALVACGGDDTTQGTTPTTDSGTDGTTPHPSTDGGEGGAPDTGTQGDGGSDAGGKIDFAAFVTDLITNHTNSTEAPKDIPPDDQLTDKQDPNDYPASFFP